MRPRLFITFASLVLAACTAASPSAPSPEVTVAPIRSVATPLTASVALIGGRVLTQAHEPEMIGFFADGGSLIARSTRDGPSPYRSWISRADPPQGGWRKIYESDAHFRVQSVTAGKIALLEYREPYQGGGAYSEDLVVVDLATGATASIDRWSLSAATYRGGGGGPRRAVGAIALGRDRIAWTRVVELAGGEVEGELRVAALGDASGSRSIARSRIHLRPLSVDQRSVIYLHARSQDQDELRMRDLISDDDRLIAVIPGSARSARSGSWLGWLSELAPVKGAPPPTVTLYTIDLATGAKREVTIGAGWCGPFSGNDRYFAWQCGPIEADAVIQVFDTSRWTIVDAIRPAPGRPVAVTAVAGGLVWTEGGAARQVHLLSY